MILSRFLRQILAGEVLPDYLSVVPFETSLLHVWLQLALIHPTLSFVKLLVEFLERGRRTKFFAEHVTLGCLLRIPKRLKNRLVQFLTI